MIPNCSMQKAKAKGERQGGASDGFTGKRKPHKRNESQKTEGKQEEASQPEEEKRKKKLRTGR